MSDQQDIEYYKAKLQEKNAEFQSYKQECKQIQQMLEEQNQKKQSEIKQLKQQAIKRQKGQKMMKTQVSQFQAQIQNLKGQLAEATKNQSTSNENKEQISKYITQNSSLKEKISQLQAKAQQLTNQRNQLSNQFNDAKNNIQELKKSLVDAENKIKVAQTSASSVVPPHPQNNKKESTVDVSKYEQQIKKLKQKYTALQKQKSKQQKQFKQDTDKLKHECQQKVKKAIQTARNSSSNKQQKTQKKRQQSHQPKQIKQAVPLSQHRSQVSKLKENIHSLEQNNQKLQHVNQQNKQKIQFLSNQKSNLMQKINNLSKEVQKQRDRANKLAQQVNNQNNVKYESPNKRQSSQQIMIMDQSHHENYNNGQGKQLGPLVFDCLLLTKKHYISPFIQIKDNKMIKFFKSTKNGFEKSLGATKHKFSSIGYDTEALVHKTVNDVKGGIENQANYHSIVIYGAKSTNKSFIMSSILQQLKQLLISKIDEIESSEQNKINCLYILKSQQQEQNYVKEGSTKDQVVQIIQKIINMNESNNSSPSKSQVKSTKKNQRSGRIRYFSLSIAQDFSIEIVTTSYLNPFLKNNQTFMDYINTVVYSKLPNILQSSLTNYHIITTLNPIVSLYEDCKNTLSITLVPMATHSSSHSLQSSPVGGSTMLYTNSPKAINVEDLNDLTKKKLQSFQKQTQQAGLRVRRYEQECAFYKSRFEQLEVRLKNLINTHQQQNTYLKKSPVTLSYEKLLKFVNTVLARNVNLGSTVSRGNISPNFGGNTMSNEQYQNQVNIYIEEDAKSLDGY